MDELRFPELIKRLYSTVADLEAMFPGRSFALDGHLIGSIGECLVSHHYGVELFAPSNEGHDGKKDVLSVEIKATQGKVIAIRSKPEHLVVVQLDKRGGFEEAYNGPGGPVWDLVKDKKMPKNGQYQIPLSKLRKLMKTIPQELKLKRSI